MNKRIFSVGIAGSYGGFNLGDEAILTSIIAQLRESADVKITVFSRNDEDTKKRYDIDTVVPILKLGREEISPYIKNLDLLIVGGGGILFDEWVKHHLWIVPLAKENNVKVMFYAIGSAPLKEPDAQALVRRSVGMADVVTVREKNAKIELEKLGITREIHLTADPALLLVPEELPVSPTLQQYFHEDQHIVGISVREPGVAAADIDTNHYHMLLANAADYMVDRFDTTILFVPMEPKNADTQHSHAVISKMRHPQKAHVLNGEYTPGQILSLVGHFSFTVGMRLHFLIFSALTGVPFVALPYASKVSGFVEDMHLAMPPLSDVTSGTLLSYIDRAWDLKAEVTSHIKEHLPALQERAKENNRLAIALLQEKL